MDSDRLLTAHDYADATGASGLRRAILLALTSCSLTFGQWTQVTAPKTVTATASPSPEAPVPSLAIAATPPSRPRRRRTPTATAASTGAPA